MFVGGVQKGICLTWSIQNNVLNFKPEQTLSCFLFSVLASPKRRLASPIKGLLVPKAYFLFLFSSFLIL